MSTGASICQRGVAPYWNMPCGLSNIQQPIMLNSRAYTYQRGGSTLLEQCMYPFVLQFITICNFLFSVLPHACHKWPVLPNLPEWLRLTYFHNYLWPIFLTNHASVCHFLHNLCGLHVQSAIYIEADRLVSEILLQCFFNFITYKKWIKLILKDRHLFLILLCTCLSTFYMLICLWCCMASR